jgi:cardiolipin synthase
MLSGLAQAWSSLVGYLSAHLTFATLASLVVLGFDAWAIARVLTRSRGVQTTLAWIFSIVAFPAAGALAFLILANPHVKRVKLKRRRAAALARKKLGLAPPETRRPGDAEAADSLIDLASSLTALPPTGGTAVTYLVDEEETYSRIERAIHAARRFVWVEYYIIKDDETGRRFLALLHQRAMSGIEVRLIYDAFGSLRINSVLLKGIAAAGGQIRAFQPMNPLRRRLAIHLRNHRKLVIVDGEVGFTGGMNVGNEYSGRMRKRTGQEGFRDSHLELRGPAVHLLAHAFIEDWSFACGEALKHPDPPPPVPDATGLVAIVPSGPDQEHNASAMVHFAGIASARHRVQITSPYFIPDEATVAALVSSALRRVDVRVILPRSTKTDVPLAALAARSFYGTLLRGGVRIFEYEPRMLHAKTMVVDGQVAFVGSANVDVRSFRLNFEIGALISDRRFASELEKIFVRDLAQSHEVTLEELERTRWRTKVRWALARLISPLL